MIIKVLIYVHCLKSAWAWEGRSLLLLLLLWLLLFIITNKILLADESGPLASSFDLGIHIEEKRLEREFRLDHGGP